MGSAVSQPKVNEIVAAVLLAELDTSASMPRSFFAERILVELLHLSGGWYGITASISRFCPHTLPIGTEVVGPIVDGHCVISVRLDGDNEVPVKPEQIAKGGTFAVMFSPRGQPGTLQSANPFCPNPSCVNVCSLTYSKVDQALREMIVSTRSPPTVSPKAQWACNLCGATMLVDRSSFDALYKM